MCMLHAAEFRALTAINPGALSPNTELVRPARDEILFACEARHPERVNNVDSFELKAHIATDGDMNFVRRLEPLLRTRPGLFDVPPPLQPATFDHELAIVARLECS